MSVINEIAAERRRQIEQEGFSAAHDDVHIDGVLATAAAVYVFHAANEDNHEDALELARRGEAPDDWPWDEDWFKPKTPRADLVRAAALIVAEIERMDRAAAATSDCEARGSDD